MSERRAGGYWALLRDNRNYRFLWAGQVVSLLGDWFNLIASAALVAQLTESGLAIGALFALRMLAPFLVSPLAGVAADRYNRKRLLILTDVLRGITVLGFLLVREPSQVWLLYTLTAIQLGLSGFFFPTRTAIVPDVVSQEQLGAANVIGSTTWSVMLAAGAALGGLVAGTWGNDTAFVVDALTFGLSALLIAAVRYAGTPASVDSEARPGGAVREYVDGLRYLRDHSDVLTVVLHKGVAALFVSSAMQVVLVALAEDVYPIGEGGSLALGLLYGVAGIGTGFGPVLVRALTGDDPQRLRWAITGAYGVSIVGLLVISSLATFPIVLLGTFLRGFGGGTIWVFSTQLLFQSVPGEVRGRVFAMEFALFSLFSAVGVSMAGVGLDIGWGLAPLVAAMAGLALLPAVAWSAWLVGRARASAA